MALPVRRWLAARMLLVGILPGLRLLRRLPTVYPNRGRWLDSAGGEAESEAARARWPAQGASESSTSRIRKLRKEASSAASCLRQADSKDPAVIAYASSL